MFWIDILEKLDSHDSKYIDNDSEHQRHVTHSSKSAGDDSQQQSHCRPSLSKFYNSQLKIEDKTEQFYYEINKWTKTLEQKYMDSHETILLIGHLLTEMHVV